MKAFALLLTLTSHVFASEPTESRQRELRNLLKHDCGACHGLTLQGGLGPSLLPADLADKSDDFLIMTILMGREGTAMPPWSRFLNRDEAAWLVDLLKKPQP
ncbi:MAG: c-type cytochrome [Gammaproteobacteria bacterium]